MSESMAAARHGRAAAIGFTVGAQRDDVAIGDTFNHAGDSGGAWEVTRALSADVWRLDRGPGVAVATSAELLDGRTWMRTRAV